MAVYNDFHPTQMQTLLQDSDSIKQSINNILSTKILTIPGQPEFGTNLDRFLFEPMDFITVHQIEETVMSSLYTNEPRITNIQVNVTEQQEYNRVFVEIYFLIKDTNTSEQVIIKLR
jgi:hypothetical protein